MKRRALVALNAAVLASVMLGGTALAASVDPVVVDGNPVCSGTGGPSGLRASDSTTASRSIRRRRARSTSAPARSPSRTSTPASIRPPSRGRPRASRSWRSSSRAASNANVYYYNPPATTTDFGPARGERLQPHQLLLRRLPDAGQPQGHEGRRRRPRGLHGHLPGHGRLRQGGTFDGDIDYPNTGYRTSSTLPAGAECTVTERDASRGADGYTWGDPYVSPATRRPSRRTASRTSPSPTTLNLIPPPEVGSLKITKVIPACPRASTGSFDVRVTCAGSDPIDATIDYPTPGSSPSTTSRPAPNARVIETSRSAPPAGFQWAGALFAARPRSSPTRRRPSP